MSGAERTFFDKTLEDGAQGGIGYATEFGGSAIRSLPNEGPLNKVALTLSKHRDIDGFRQRDRERRPWAY